MVHDDYVSYCTNILIRQVAISFDALQWAQQIKARRHVTDYMYN